MKSVFTRIAALSAVFFAAGAYAGHADAQTTTWSPTKAVTTKLGLPNRFLVGLGNDVGAPEGWNPNNAHTFTLGPKLDIHYLYLSGMGWRSWTPVEGAYITQHANAAKAKGVIPMFTLYQAAALGDGNLAPFNDANFMKTYWRGVRVMFEKLGAFNSPAIAHLEPDLWGYAQKKGGDDPAKIPVKVGSVVPECAGMPENVAGLGKCMVRLARRLAPKTAIGFSASTFGAYTNGVSDPKRIAAYLNKIGSTEADFLVVETLDRDAGCFEAGWDANCKRSGTFYWSDAAYRSHLAWAKAINVGTGKGLLWWQMPLGVPSATKGGTSFRYRDNRVQWLFSHPYEFVAAGGIGAVFGTGAPNQTTVKTDNGQFKAAVTRYYQAPAWFN